MGNRHAIVFFRRPREKPLLFRPFWSTISAMKEKTTPYGKLGKTFYIVLLLLTAALLAFLSVWALTGNDLFLYLLLGVVPLYVLHLVFHLVKADKDYKKQDELKSAFFSLAREEQAEIVYLTYLGDEKHLLKPSPRKREYLIEFYTRAVDLALLKRHLWFGLSEEEEERLIKCRLGSMEIPYPLLEEVRGRTVLVQSALFRAAKDSPLFSPFFSGNTILLYDE